MISDFHTSFARIAIRNNLTAGSALKLADKLYDGHAARYLKKLLADLPFWGGALSIVELLDAMERHSSTAALRLHDGDQAASLRVFSEGSQVDAVGVFIGEWTKHNAAADVEVRSNSVQLQFLTVAIADVPSFGPSASA